MRVDFRKGIIRRNTGEEIPCVWAETPYGAFLLAQESEEELEPLDPADIITASLITSLDLSGVDRDLAETVIWNILHGKYLERPGVQGKGDAVLFVLVNEAIQKLQAVMDEESREES